MKSRKWARRRAAKQLRRAIGTYFKLANVTFPLSGSPVPVRRLSNGSIEVTLDVEIYPESEEWDLILPRTKEPPRG